MTRAQMLDKARRQLVLIVATGDDMEAARRLAQSLTGCEAFGLDCAETCAKIDAAFAALG